MKIKMMNMFIKSKNNCQKKNEASDQPREQYEYDIFIYYQNTI